MEKTYKKHSYLPETAGSQMTSRVPTALPEERILDIRKRLFEKSQEFETLNYIYIVDREKKLVGVISLKNVFQNPEETKITDIIARNIVKVRVHTDQERVAILALKHNLKAIPVVDKDNVFLGAVPPDIILEILHSEDVEDMLRFAGIAKHDTFSIRSLQASPAVLTKLRLPWLVLGLFGGLFAAQIVNLFEGPLRTHFILAAFIPLILYMAGAAGAQTETLFIRSLVYRVNIRDYFFREIRVSFFIAVFLGVLLALISYAWFGIFYIGIVLGVSLFFTTVTAFILGLLVPYLFKKFRKDPAIASGPVGTIMRDVSALIIYFSIASTLLRFAG